MPNCKSVAFATLIGCLNALVVAECAVVTKENDSTPSVAISGPVAKESSIDPRLSKKCPSLASSIVIKAYEKGKFVGIVLINRGRPPLGHALPGGLVRYGETVEQCAKRTLFDECGIPIVSNLMQFQVYSDPSRDPRMHVIDTVFSGRIDDITLNSGTDAKHAWICPIDKIDWNKLAFDHRVILKNFLDRELTKSDKIITTEKTNERSNITKTERNSNDFRAAMQKAYHPPFLATSVIIEIYEKGVFKGIVLIKRGKPPFGMAIPGGHVEFGESVDFAARREMREECNLDIKDLKQFKVYSNPDRDSRKHTIDVIQIARVDDTLPKASSDAAEASIYPFDSIPWNDLAFDHAKILRDYIDYRNGKLEAMCNNL